MASSLSEPYSTMKFNLRNNTQMPAIGLGTYKIRKPEEVLKAVDYALEAGYRMFDTAAVYGNEIHLKTAFQTLLPKYDLEREDIFVTTKLSPSEHGGKDAIERSYMKSMTNLGFDYIDLYLIHYPGSTHLGTHDLRNKNLRNMSWSSIEQLYDDGRINAIGVSNFTINHLKDLQISNHSILPTVNQVEFHPYYHQKELLEYCKKNDIVLQAYSSLGGASSSDNQLMEDPVIQKIAKKLDVTCAQVLLVWALQQDVAVIPKSKTKKRIEENISLNFRLSDDHVKAINELSEKNHKYAWDPSDVA